MGLKPVCLITGGTRTAETINSRLVSCDVVDASGVQSDSVTLTIDAAGLTVWPDTGGVIGVKMGYEESGAVALGEFRLTRISEQLVPNTLTLTGTAAQWQAADPSELKKRRSASYESISIQALVTEKAKKHGLSPRIHPDLAATVIEHIDQTNEADLQFLSRLARKYDAVCKPFNTLLVFSRRGQTKTLTGRVMEPVKVTFPRDNSVQSSSFTTASISSSDKQKFSGVRAFWYSSDGATSHEVTAGSRPWKSLRQKYESAQAAQAACEAELRKIDRESDQLSLDCPGNPQMAAEGLLTLDLFPSERMNATWSADRVTHKYSRQTGYRTTAKASKPVRQ